jgi:hypothetical protein
MQHRFPNLPQWSRAPPRSLAPGDNYPPIEVLKGSALMGLDAKRGLLHRGGGRMIGCRKAGQRNTRKDRCSAPCGRSAQNAPDE